MKRYRHVSIAAAILSVLSVCIGAALVDKGAKKESGEVNRGFTIEQAEDVRLRKTQSSPLNSNLPEEKGSQVSTKAWLVNAEHFDPSFSRPASRHDNSELPFERRLMKGKQLPDGDMEDMMISSAISSNHSVSEYEKESYLDPDPDIRSQTRIYSEAAQQAVLSSRTAVRLDGLACGSRICLGILSGGTEQDYTAWASVFSERPELLGLGLTRVVVPGKAGRSILRFAFATQPFLYVR